MRTMIVIALTLALLVACSSSSTNPAELFGVEAGADAADSGACGVLASGDALHSGETLKSCSGDYFASMQVDGNFALYGPTGVLWAKGQPGVTTATMQVDGALTLTDSADAVIWSSGTSTPGSYLVVQDGQLVIYAPNAGAVWSAP